MEVTTTDQNDPDLGKVTDSSEPAELLPVL